MNIITDVEKNAFYKKLHAEALHQIISIAPNLVDEILSNSEIIEIKKNECIQQEGMPAKYLYVLLDGLVREHIKGDDDEDISVVFRTEGEAFGSVLSIVTGEPAFYSISAINTSILARGDGKIFYSIAKKHQDVMNIVNTGLANSYTSMYKRLICLLKKDIPEQLSGRGELSLDLIERLPGYHLASYLRITPESLSRIKKKMKDEQLNNKEE